MRLNQFIKDNIEPIMLEWESFARTMIPPAETMSVSDLRDHAHDILLAIAQDMASVFQASPDRFLDEKIGRRLRDEVYAAGASREVSESVERFLGRKPSTQSFLKFVGVEAPPAAKP